MIPQGKWKVICKIRGWALGRYHDRQIKSFQNHKISKLVAQQNKCKKKLIQKINKKYLGKSTSNHKKDSMEKGQLTYKELIMRKQQSELFNPRTRERVCDDDHDLMM